MEYDKHRSGNGTVWREGKRNARVLFAQRSGGKLGRHSTVGTDTVTVVSQWCADDSMLRIDAEEGARIMDDGTVVGRIWRTA